MGTSKTPPDPRIASVVWVLVAVVFSAMSAYLTHVITRVDRHPQQLGIAVYLSDHATSPVRRASVVARAEPTVEFVSEDDGIDLTFSNLAGDPNLDRLLFGPIPKDLEKVVRCDGGFQGLDELLRVPPIPIDATRIVGTPSETNAVYAELGLALPGFAPPPPDASDPAAIVLLQRNYDGSDPRALSFFSIRLARAPEPGDAITCHIPNVIVHETFTSRAFRLVIVRATNAPLELSDPDSVSFTDEDEHDARVTTVNSGVTVLGTSVFAPFPKTPVKGKFPTRCEAYSTISTCGAGQKFVSDDVVLAFAWDSITATQRRDIYIVIIGSLIALAAAALIEASRPFIDLFVSRFS
jgi:hypothetical protein